MTTTNDVIEVSGAWCGLSCFPAPNRRPRVRSDFLFCRQLARLFLEHHRNIVSNRVSEPARAANQFRLALAVEQRALAYGANENVEQFRIHGQNQSFV